MKAKGPPGMYIQTKFDIYKSQKYRSEKTFLKRTQKEPRDDMNWKVKWNAS